MYHYGYYMMAPTSVFPFGGLLGIIFWILLISLIIGFLVHFFDNRDTNDYDEKDNNYVGALGILKRRYAKGEITKKEFLEMKKDVS
jgi:putative membrane protein